MKRSEGLVIPWTQFMDMCSGGGLKERWTYIYIQAPKEEAIKIFYNLFGHSPLRVSCTCCGEDYSITESPSLKQATAYDRNCAWNDRLGGYAERTGNSYGNHIPLEKYLKDPTVLFIYDKEVKPLQRLGEVPKQGYVWVD